MKTRTALSSLGIFLAGFAVCLASDLMMGTWKLNEAKSKLTPGGGKNTTVVYAPSGGDVKVTVDGVDKDGKPTHNEWTGRFDGKEYPVTGDPNSDMRAYKMIDAHKLDMTIKKGGKVTITGTIEVAHDGKTRTVETKGTDPSGKEIKNKAVFDKQ